MFNYNQIKTYEDACSDQNKDPLAIPDFSMLPEGQAKYLAAALKLAIIADSLNKDDNGNLTKADWNNTDERKWSNFMNVEADEEHPSGSGLSFDVAACVSSFASVPARLTCRIEEISEYFFTQFKDIWEDFILHR